MDFIRPIGPVERDLQPVARVSPDAEREQHEQPDRPPRRKPPAPAQADPVQPPPPGDDEDGPSLIDVRV
jgi:hypothetical protein